MKLRVLIWSQHLYPSALEDKQAVGEEMEATSVTHSVFLLNLL